MYHSWNMNPKVGKQYAQYFSERYQELPKTNHSMIAYGNGRSYGDVCLNSGGTLILTKRLNHFIEFDPTSGLLKCESGVLLKDILDVVASRGWFLPVVPGTQFVTVGGAIANDVHGKNHHSHGSFGRHVASFELLRSDGERLVCSPASNREWFESTVGGMGLTGLITWAEIQLMPIQSTFMNTLSQRFESLNDYWKLMEQAKSKWMYNVAWIDCLAKGRELGRGVLTSAEHTVKPMRSAEHKKKNVSFPLTPPISLVNKVSLTLFNSMYFHLPRPTQVVPLHYLPYFFPLDSIYHWNRMYGKKGFFQYQCVIPPQHEKSAVEALLKTISDYGLGSFLAVLKSFSNIPTAGLMSFPREGATLALDFPNNGRKTLALFNELDQIVRQANGALYPAKDARMPIDMFAAGYPALYEFQRFIDPRFSSSFWRRVTR
ncbi:FAD-binding oxidoreductase [Marinomonas fungiae]|uniref:FAD/FMN-containing dehydrogenase n=1 Tax=Marinomonas fungiae TaxID=1137284 RepID=A0A0K6II49_9GAMM|nr:FAD-binding oxidoreductase [Marinomonas fungiae]CUB02779.1 FAD/FMN-containing dehydrogenase [Marinomonas fungiae]